MADVVCHSLMGAALMSYFPKKRGWKWAMFALGAVFGAWPDAYPWLQYQLGCGDRWSLYNVYHHSWTWFDLLPPFGLHVVSDIPFHPYPGFNWWPSLIFLDAFYLAIAVWIFWYSFTVRTETA